MRLSTFLLPALLVALAGRSATAGINLGTANDYNVFVLGNDTQSNTDAQGRVAVGGNALFGGGGYTVASNRGGTTTNNLVVGGNYSNTYNTANGNVVVGGNAAINGPTINGNLSVGSNLSLSGYGTVAGNITYGGSISNPNTTVSGSVSKGAVSMPVDFAAEKSYLTNLSTRLGALSSTGSATFNGNSATNTMGQFSLTGTVGTIDVFHIKGSDLALANGFSISAPSGATVVIDVDGTADRMQNFGFNLSGVDRQHVLFNFNQATSLSIGGVGIQGSVLAPLAAINFNNGNIDGTLIGDSVAGGGESHDFMFRGDFSSALGSPPSITPSAGAVPEPAAVVSTLSGLAMAGAAALRRRRRAFRAGGSPRELSGSVDVR